MQRFDVNPSVATIVNFDPIWRSEVKKLKFTGSSDWPGTYTLTFWNSDKKNTKLTIPTDNLTVDGALMTMIIKAEADSLLFDNIYYEIYSDEMKAIIIVGEIKIRK